ncbi:MAG: beta strand repeat-containing protein, partial [Tagaea sp.]
IAITGTTGNGTWQYTTDSGTTWTSVGTVSGTSALLLRGAATDQLRYAGDNNNGVSADFTFRRWDQTSGTQGNKVDVSTNGGTTAFSSNTATGTLTVTSVNDAPTLTNATVALTTAFGSPNEDQTTAGVTAATVLTNFTSGDVDTGAVSGIAITGTTGNGTWQYTTDGTNWNNVGTVSGTSARLLASANQLRYAGDSANGETASFTFRRWDTTSGTAGGTADPSTNGGTTAYSANTATGNLVVTSVNDAPTIGGLSAVNTTPGTAVSPFSAITVADVDTGASLNVTVTLANTASGTLTAASLTAAGFTDAGGGTFTRNGITPATAQTALRALSFLPTATGVTVGTTVALNDGTVTTNSTVAAITVSAPATTTTNTVSAINITQVTPPPSPSPSAQPPQQPAADGAPAAPLSNAAAAQSSGQFISGQQAAAIFSGGQGGASVGGISAGGGVVSANQGSTPVTGIAVNFADSRSLGSIAGTLTGSSALSDSRLVTSFNRVGDTNTTLRVIQGENGLLQPVLGQAGSGNAATFAALDPLTRALAAADAIRIDAGAPIRVDGAGIEAARPQPGLQAQLAAAAAIFDADAARLAEALSAGFDG